MDHHVSVPVYFDDADFFFIGCYEIGPWSIQNMKSDIDVRDLQRLLFMVSLIISLEKLSSSFPFVNDGVNTRSIFFFAPNMKTKSIMNKLIYQCCLSSRDNNTVFLKRKLSINQFIIVGLNHIIRWSDQKYQCSFILSYR